MAYIANHEWDVLTKEVTYRSDVMYEIYGTTPEQAPSDVDGLMLIIHPDDRDGVMAVYEAAQLSGTVFSMDYRIVRPDGEVRHVNDLSGEVCDWT
jgi:PAS domain-containing protein